MPLQRADPLPGSLLQRRYRVAGRIASGGMGSVFRAHDLRLDRDVAVKVLHAHLATDDVVRVRFRDEARHAARVRHHNVVAVLDHDEHEAVPFIVMELVDGPSLRTLLHERGRLSPHAAVSMLTAACAGLGAVHDVGLVHRDVKPANLLLDRTGDIRVADFGIARALDSTGLTPAGTLLGSMQYLAPEVVLGQPATFASDQYSLGVVAFEALTGAPPLPADVPLAAALRRARETVPPPSSVRPDIPGPLDHAIVMATATDPARRHATLTAFLAALRAAVAASDADRQQRDPTDILSAPHHPTRLWASPSDGAPPRRPGLPAPRTARRAAASPPEAGRPRAARLTDPEPQAGPATTDHPPRSRRSGPRPVAAPAAGRGTGRRAPLSARPAPADADPVDRPAVPPQRPVYIRARMSALAVVALLWTLAPAGAVVAPLLGVFALRRIDRSCGALRGEAVAGLAIVVGLARLAVVLLQQS